MARRFGTELGVLALMLSAASAAVAADHSAVVSGVVRDGHGVPQMGAVVEILSAGSVVRATAFTDMQGRYSVAELLPGSYGVRATAALLMPAIRSNLHLTPGHRSVVNLTLTALFDDTSWLPVQTRRRDEMRDDWTWTLRSTAGRPILKVADDGVFALPRGESRRVAAAVIHARVRVSSGSKRFGEGSSRMEADGARIGGDGGRTAVTASVAPTESGGEAATDLSMRYERPAGLAGVAGGRVSYRSRPEILTAGGATGLRVLSVSSAERFGVGDFGAIEAGSRVIAVSGLARTTVAQPFVRVDLHPAARWAVSYHVATSADTQDYEDATADDGALPVCAVEGGRARVVSGIHQQAGVSHRDRGTVVAVAYYADALNRVALTGGGAGLKDVAAGELGGAALVDSSNGTFAELAQGYDAAGVNLMVSQLLREGMWVALEYSTGSALAMRPGAAPGMGGALPTEVRRGQAATVAVRSKVARSGTSLRVSYRWQPGVLVTDVDPYNVAAGGEYLSLHVRQPLNLPGMLPMGLELTIDGSNLLRQGYRVFDASRGAPMYVAASPQSVQAGLAFNF